MFGPAWVSKVLNEPGLTGVYYDEKGQPMLCSALVRDPKFQDRVVAETRAFLSTIPK
jgi:galactose-1-phosphate uridylyltransferase